METRSKSRQKPVKRKNKAQLEFPQSLNKVYSHSILSIFIF